jgi:hypothetical protein
MLGLQQLIYPESEAREKVEDIFILLNEAEQQFGSLDQLPFSEIMPSIVSFEGRKRRRK